MSPEDGRCEREARSLALERAYVHDVYDQISSHFATTRYRAWPRVKQFVGDLEPGSLVADIGCGNGKYLQVTDHAFTVGVERCCNLAATARKKGSELMLSDNLCLPFREESFDACLSIAVIHHFATTERRVSAIRELARILRIGGRLMITAWAMEQRHRKFESQDVLVPWHRPEVSSSDDKTSLDRDPNSTTTDEEDVLHYHACHQSDETREQPRCTRKRSRRRSAARFRLRDGDGRESTASNREPDDDDDEGDYKDDDGSDAEDSAECCSAHCGFHSRCDSEEATSPKESCYSFVRRALQVASPDTPQTQEQKLTSGRRLSVGKAWSLTGHCDWNIATSDGDGKKVNCPCGHSLDNEENPDDVPIELRHLEPEDPALLYIPSPGPPPNSGISVEESPSREVKSPDDVSSLSTGESFVSSLLTGGSCSPLIPLISSDVCDETTKSTSCTRLNLYPEHSSAPPLFFSAAPISNNSDTAGSDPILISAPLNNSTELRRGRKRPTLRKQKTSILDTDIDPPVVIEISKAEKNTPGAETGQSSLIFPGSIEKDYLTLPKIGIMKQSSLDDQVIYLDRFMENERIKKSVQKQSSLNDDLIYGNNENKRESWKERLFKTQLRHLQILKESFQKLRAVSLDRFDLDNSESLKNTLIKLLNSWRNELLQTKATKTSKSTKDGDAESDAVFKSTVNSRTSGEAEFNTNNLLKAQSLFPPKSYGDGVNHRSDKKLSVTAHNLQCTESRECKSSRDESSDSSKENSFQSDTSLDSEDSCISVIFVPKNGQGGMNNSDKERNRSISSESSEGSDKPNSPKSPKSPAGGRYFSCGKFLGTKNTRGVGTWSKLESKRLSPPLEQTNEPSTISLLNSLPQDSSASGTNASISLSIESEGTSTASNTIMISNEPKSIDNGPGKNLLDMTPHLESDPCILNTFVTTENKIISENHLSTKLSQISLPSPSACNNSKNGNNSHNGGNSNNCRNSSSIFPLQNILLTSSDSSETKPKAIIESKSVMLSSSIRPSITKPSPHLTCLERCSYEKVGKSSKRNDTKIAPLSSLVSGENIEIIRKKVSVPGSKEVQIVRKSVPRFLTFEVFNPETDDLDSDSSPSSSPHSGSSVIEKGWPTDKEIEELDREIKRKEEEERLKTSPGSLATVVGIEDSDELPKVSLVEPVHRMDTISEEAHNSDNSRENSPKEKGFPKVVVRKSSNLDSLLRPKHPSLAPMRPGTHSSSSGISYVPSSSSSLVAYTSPMQDDMPPANKTPPPLTSSVLSQQSSIVNLKSHNPCVAREEMSNIGYPHSLTNTILCASYSPRHSNRFSKSPSLDTSESSNSYSLDANFHSNYPSCSLQDGRTTAEMSRDYSPSLFCPISGSQVSVCGRHSVRGRQRRESRHLEQSWIGSKSTESLTETSLLTEPLVGEKRQHKSNYGSVLSSNFTSKRKTTMAHLGEKGKFSDIICHDKHLSLKDGSASFNNFREPQSFRSVSPEPPYFFIPDQTQTEKKSLELPSFMNSLWGGSSTSATLKEAYNYSFDAVPASYECYKNLSKRSSISNCRKSSLKVKTKDTKSVKMNRSESSLPLLFLEETEPLVLPFTSDSDEGNVPERGRTNASPPKPKKKLDSTSQISSSSTISTMKNRYECRYCKKEEEKKRKKNQEILKEREKKLVARSRSTKEKKDCLHLQSSLDSAMGKENRSSDWPGISKSSSLDIETSKIQEILSKEQALSMSQDSLQSDVGGAPTLHRYYHVFKEGELDKLIEKYVHNLHIISSYYDHANWCIIAEKVQVWTI